MEFETAKRLHDALSHAMNFKRLQQADLEPDFLRTAACNLWSGS